MISEFRFGPWLPDAADFKNPGLEICTNAVPSPSGYQPAFGAVDTASQVTGTVIGGRVFERKGGTAVVCIATTGDLFTIVGGTVQASSLSLSLATSDQVVFEQFGVGVYASTKNGDTWYLANVESDTSFVAVPNSPPNANAMGRVADFLVLGDVNDGTDNPYRVRWSQFNNPTGAWTTDIATQSDFQDLDQQNGPVTAISGGSFGMVFQKNGISRMTYIGGAAVFSFDLYEKNRGCAAPLSVLRVGDVAYFLTYDGFFRTDGASTQPISRGRIWDWFLANSNNDQLPSVTGAIDWERRCCVWNFAGVSSATPTGQLWFNWETESWSYVEQPLDLVLSSVKSGLTLEQVASTYGNIDTMPISLDSATFRGSGRTLQAINNGYLANFTGPALSATLATGDFQPQAGKRVYVRAVTPLILNNDENTTVSIGYRDRQTGAILQSPATQIGSLGFAPVAVDGRYVSVSHTLPSGAEWSDAYGFQLDFDPSGDV